MGVMVLLENNGLFTMEHYNQIQSAIINKLKLAIVIVETKNKW